jgi:hypothetical protein
MLPEVNRRTSGSNFDSMQLLIIVAGVVIVVAIALVI